MLGNDMMNKAGMVPTVGVMARPETLEFPGGQTEYEGMKQNKIMAFFFVRR